MVEYWPPNFRPAVVAEEDDRNNNQPHVSPQVWRESAAGAAPQLPGLMNLNFIYANSSPKPSSRPSTPSMAATPGLTGVDDGRSNGPSVPPRTPTLVDGPPPMKRTGSNISSTSSDILVAPGVPPEPRRDQSRPGPIENHRPTAPLASILVGTGILIIRLPPDRLRGVLRRDPVKPHFDSEPSTQRSLGDTGGPNARGTYSKEHTLQHPEISWVHRGQGRYLPASALKSESTPSSARQQRQSFRDNDHNNNNSNDNSFTESWAWRSADPSQHPTNGINTSTPQSATPGEVKKRRRRPVEETLTDSLSPAPVYGLRRRISSQQSPDAGEERSARLARRVKSFFEGDRRYSQTSQYSDTEKDSSNEEDEGLEDDEDEDMEDTFDKAYVDAHPEETFYHAGNGWYKHGKKPRGGRRIKARDQTDNIVQNADGSWDFDPTKTIHESQLPKFPGCEFWHAGNGWFKAGSAPSGKKTSIIVPYPPDTAESSFNDAEGSFGGQGGSQEGVNGKYSKEYTLAHPEFEWIHRGKGRYIKVDTARSTARDNTPNSVDRRNSRTDATYDKEYVDAHPDEKFHHTGNGRWKRGPKPSRQSSSVRDEPLGGDYSNRSDYGAHSEMLYDRAYVDAHPFLEFHHRGQGRYKLGPREPRRSTIQSNKADDYGQDSSSIEAEYSEQQYTSNDRRTSGRSFSEGLVDSEYVDAHPEQNFYHKGQGRWARGLPPKGSSHKTAVRGPSSKDWNSEFPTEAEEDLRGVPGLTALVLKVDGPDKFPDIEWHYRGGGKWSRITKQAFEERTNPKAYKPATYSRKSRGRGVNDGPAEHESIVDDDQYGDDDGNYQGRGAGGEERAPKRRRRTKYGAYQTNEDFGTDSKSSSKAQSKTTTPRPPIMAPEDDVLTEADLPDLYRGSHSPPDTDKDDEAGKLYRKLFRPLNIDDIINSLQKHDPAVRPTANLKQLAANAQRALMSLQDEYLSLERITAPHAKIPRKLAKGGRLPVEYQIFEDKKEADLYDYTYDGRKVGHQDPDAQKILRDADGRELRKRRQRHGVDGTGTIPGWHLDDGDLTSKRPSRQPTRFDGSAAPSSRRRAAASNNTTGRVSASVTPDRATAPVSTAQSSQLANGYEPPKTGRWAGHIPKRIRELRDESVGTVRSDNSSNSTNSNTNPGEPKPVRKGRPPGSKNHHKRKDAGIKKGPRKKPALQPAPVEGQPGPAVIAPSTGAVPVQAVPPSQNFPDGGYVIKHGFYSGIYGPPLN